MASLTPGVLSKLLQHASTDVRVAGEHRSSLLQVIGIVPRGEDPLQTRGFFLKVSDSLHSSYVSISDEDADMIFSDKIQLGQFIYVSRLDSASPVPVLRGIKPVPKRRPCIGNPEDLVSGELLILKDNAECKVTKKTVRAKDKGKTVSAVNKVVDNTKTLSLVGDDIKSRRKSLANAVQESKEPRRKSLANAVQESKEPRRLSLDSVRKKGWQNDKGSKNRLSAQLFESKWKDTSSTSDSASVVSDRIESLRSNAAFKHETVSSSPTQIKTINTSYRSTDEQSNRDSKSPQKLTPLLAKLHLSPKNWEHCISWDQLPSILRELGKDSIRHRNSAYFAAVDALLEASAAESVIRSLSIFAEICAAVEHDPALLLVEQFLSFYDNMQQAANVIDAVLKVRSLEAKTRPEAISKLLSVHDSKIFTHKSIAAKSWTQAALENDLSAFSLLTKQVKGEDRNLEQLPDVTLENSPNLTDCKLKGLSPQRKDTGSKKQSSSWSVKFPAGKKPDGEKREWSKGQGLKEVANLADVLVSVSRGWFLKYLDCTFDDGFRGRGDGEITTIIGQLRRVNQWLEKVTGEKFEVDERVEKLRKKLYSFLLEHVDSSLASNNERR
ncbi:uncharacterized protein [Aristolochia californica]|uniref:uncharacterized protein n=1 Tax=Aristolochia californica TaxID=171875 RepID=UPI0035D85108